MVKGEEKGRSTTPGQNHTSVFRKDTLMVHDSPPEHTGLVLVFRVDQPEQAQALHGYRSAFGAATHIEALDERTYVLHVYPGVCGCGEAT